MHKALCNQQLPDALRFALTLETCLRLGRRTQVPGVLSVLWCSLQALLGQRQPAQLAEHMGQHHAA